MLASIADRQPQFQCPTPSFVKQASPHAGLENMQLRSKERAFQTQHQPVIGIAQVVNALIISDEGVEDGTQF